MDRQLVIEKLKEKCPLSPPCEMCGGTEFAVSDRIWSLMDWTPKVIRIGGSGRSMPVVAIICVQCGMIRWFSAMVLGVLDDSGESTDGAGGEQ